MLETIVYVAAHQFYLRDADLAWGGAYTNDPWGPGDGLGVAPGVIGVQCPRAAGHVPVFIEQQLDAEAEIPAGFCKVTEASIEVRSGRLCVEGEDNDETSPPLEIAVVPGTYRVRVLYAGLDTVTYDDDDGADYYLVQLVPGTPTDPVIVRGFEDVDEPVRTTDADRTACEAALGGSDSCARASAIIELARLGATAIVARVARHDPSRVMRLHATNALRLGGAGDELAALAGSDDPAIRGAVGRALEQLGA